MGLIEGLLGTAAEIEVGKLDERFGQILADQERIEKGYQLVRDVFIFTNKRLILVDKQGLITGKKVEYHSIPYRSITRFSVETAGNFDLDAELRIWVSGDPTPIQKQFNRKLSIYELQAVLTTYVAR